MKNTLNALRNNATIAMVLKFVFLHQQTPLHIAAAATEGYVKTVECLVKLGADIAIKDNNEVRMCA